MNQRARMKRSGSPAGIRPAAAAQAVRPKAERVVVAEPLVRGKWEWIWAFVLIAATLAAYQQVWRAGFIWDDDIYVTTNPLLTAADGLKRIWFSLDSPSQYFPLVYTSFRFEHALWGLNPAGYHCVNIFLHAVNAVLVWRLLRALRVPGALLAAALFALHPVQVESVAWITERKNVLMGFFFLLTLLCWTRFVERNTKERWALYIAALLFYALALLSKTTACTIPAAMLLILWLRRKPINFARICQVTPFVLMGVAMGLVSIWWEREHQGTQGQLFSVPFPDRILVVSHAIWFYLGKLVWPESLAFSYPRWPVSTANPLDFVWLGALAVAQIVILIARRWFGRSVEVALLFFVATLGPMLGLIMLYTFRYSWVADHYQYLACIGPLALGAAGITVAIDGLKKPYRYVLAAIISGVLLLSLGARIWQQGAIYADQPTLWRATIAANPGSWMAHNNLAIENLKAGQLEEAFSGYRKAIELNPDYAEAHYNLGNALARVGKFTEAAESYGRAISLYPRFAVAHANLATALFQLGREEEAIEHLRESVAIDPRVAAAQQSLGNALVRSGKAAEGTEHLALGWQTDATLPRIEHDLGEAYAKSGDDVQALPHWKRAADTDPTDGGAQSAVGMSLAQSGRVEESLPYFRKVAELEPANAQNHYNLATSLSRTGRFEEAIAQYRETLRLKPDYAAAHVNLANTFLQTGQAEEAVAEYSRALELNPNSAAAHKNLGNLLGRMGRTEEADSHLRRAAEIDAQSPPNP